MFCLLCHEKVSRLRAWRTKSEFCCDEHAEIYKRQTLERLLTDQDEGEAAETPPLPVETGGASRSDSATPAAESSAAETLARFAEHDKPAASVEERLSPGRDNPLGDEDSDEGVRELWRLAEEVGPAGKSGDDDWAVGSSGLSDEDSGFKPSPFGNFGGGSGSVTEQTPEEALAALRELSSSRSAGATLEDSGDLDTLLMDREAVETPQPQDLSALDDLETAEELPDSLGEALPDEDSLPPLDMGALEPLDDDELPSILDRLTESDSDDTELEAARETVELASDLEPVNDLEPAQATEDAAAEEVAAQEEVTEQVVEEVAAEEEQPVATVSAEEAAEETEEPLALADDSGAFDLLEEAVESHLEEREEKPADRSGSRKVVPFPLSRKKSAEPGSKQPDAPEPAAASASAKSGKGKKSGKGRSSSDLSRVNLKPVAVMFGIEPSLCEPAASAEQIPASVEALPEQNGFAEPPMCYPGTAHPERLDSQLPVYARLFAVLPELETPALLGGAEGPDSPAYTEPCVTPLPLAAERSAEPGQRSLGSERAWMVRIEPELIESAEFEIALPNGDQHSPWLAPRLPAALLNGVTIGNGSGKLDLSGSDGRYGPRVDRLCLVLPELGVLGGSPKQSSSKTQGGELAGWMPPSVLDPRFDIERPAGRDLSDFG